MKDKIMRLIFSPGFRYLFFGGVTTCVNIGTFFVLNTILGVDLITANVISIFAAITVAYVTNKLFVFEHHVESVKALILEISQFFGMRMITMVIEVFGVVLCCSIWKFPVMASKLILQIVILVLNYIFSRFFIFSDKKTMITKKELFWKKYRRTNVLIASILSFAVMTGGYIVLEVWPFGDHGMLIIDSLHQYLPFFTEFQQKLNDGSSLLYSNGGGLGYNFWSTVAYYLGSPLNYLLAFVPMKYVMDFMDWMIVLKVSACAGMFSWYLCKKSEERKEYTWYLPAAFGCMFALGNFILGYYFNLMWLDSIMVTPLVLYGIEQIVKGNSGKIFGAALFYALFCNYYIGYMICLFACLYWVIAWFAEKDISIGKFFRSAGIFAVYAFLAGGMAAIVLIPAYKGLALSASADSSFPATIKFYSNGIKELTSLFDLADPINISDNQEGLNAFCGSIVLILTVLYLLDSKIRFRERISKILLTGFLYLSFQLNILNYIWHGFHVQNGLPNRFAFLFVLMLLMMGYQVLSHIREIPLWRIAAALLPAIALPVLAWLYGWGDHEKLVYPATLVFLTVYGIILILFPIFRREKKLLTHFLTIILCLEMCLNGVHGLLENGNVGRSTYLNDQIGYQKMIAREQPQELFFRTDMDSSRMRNEAMFTGGGGLVLFNSVMSASTEEICKAIGIEARMNKNGYNGVTKLMNDVFGIRYVLSKEDGDTLYQMSRIDSEGVLSMYKNPDALAPAFVVDSEIKDWDIHGSDDPMEVQNDFVERAVGLPGIYVLDRIIDAEDGTENAVRIPANKQVYVSLKKTVDKVSLVTPEYSRDYNKFNAHLYDFGVYETEQEGSITLKLKTGQSTAELKFYTCAEAEYRSVIEALKESELSVTKATDGYLEGTIDAKKDGTLLMTFTYDPGWTVRIDGEKVMTYAVGEGLLGADIRKGSHTVVMDYTPQGLVSGSVVTLLSIALFFIVGLMEQKSRAKKEIRNTEEA